MFNLVLKKTSLAVSRSSNVAKVVICNATRIVARIYTMKTMQQHAYNNMQSCFTSTRPHHHSQHHTQHLQTEAHGHHCHIHFQHFIFLNV